MGKVIPETTLIYIEKDNKYLMLYRNKKANDLNEGFWIGAGGHIEEGETPEECVAREVKEETGLILKEYVKRGVIYFSNDDFSEVMHLYTSSSFDGDIITCDEGDLHWVDKDKILSLNIWEGDKVFLDYLIKGEKYFELKLLYKDKKLVESVRIK